MNIKKVTKKKSRSTLGGGCKRKDFTWGCFTCEAYKFKEVYGRFAYTDDELGNWARPLRAKAYEEEYKHALES